MKTTLLISFIVLFCTVVIRTQTSATWQEDLPSCPCNNPDKKGAVIGDGWARDMGSIEHFHPGAKVCFRSCPAMKTEVGRSSQQCCYNAAGKLIPCGPGAGTPDKASTCAGEDESGIMTVRYSVLMGRILFDVLPFEYYRLTTGGWRSYNRK